LIHLELNKPDPFADNQVENSCSTIENWLNPSFDAENSGFTMFALPVFT